MPDNGQACEGPDLSLFETNRRKILPEQLLAFAGMQVAWSLDGTRILAAGKDYGDVEAQVIAAGLDPARVVFGFIPAPDTLVVG